MTKTANSQDVVFDTSKTGLERTMGPLEAAIMSIIWDESKPVTIDLVQRRLTTNYRELRYTTVASTMTRMSDKGMLRRFLETNRSFYLYESVETRIRYVRRVVYAVMWSLQKEDPDVVRLWISECLDIDVDG